MRAKKLYTALEGAVEEGRLIRARLEVLGGATSRPEILAMRSEWAHLKDRLVLVNAEITRLNEQVNKETGS